MVGRGPGLSRRLCGVPAPAAGTAAPAAGAAGTLAGTAAGIAPRASATTAALVPTISAAADQFDIRRAWPMPSRRGARPVPVSAAIPFPAVPVPGVAPPARVRRGRAAGRGRPGNGH